MSERKPPASSCEILKDRIANDVRTSWLNAITAYNRVGVSQQFLDQTNLALNLSQTRYNLGLSSIVKLSHSATFSRLRRRSNSRPLNISTKSRRRCCASRLRLLKLTCEGERNADTTKITRLSRFLLLPCLAQPRWLSSKMFATRRPASPLWTELALPACVDLRRNAWRSWECSTACSESTNPAAGAGIRRALPAAAAAIRSESDAEAEFHVATAGPSTEYRLEREPHAESTIGKIDAAARIGQLNTGGAEREMLEGVVIRNWF